jgi:hypothetical protein
MLHIMDYEARESINNTLLRVATGIGIVLAATVWLLVFHAAPSGAYGRLTSCGSFDLCTSGWT